MRKLSLVLFFVLALCMGSFAFAQDAPFCGTLSADDCTLLTNSSTNTATSAAFTATLDITAENVPDTAGPVAINLVVNGAYSGLDMAAMESMSMGTDMTADPTAAIMALPALLRSFDGELSLTVSVPAELAEGGPNSITLELKLVDGIGYINFDTIAPLMGAAMGQGAPALAGWGGIDLAGAVEQFGPMLAQSMDPAMLGQMGGATGGIDPALITTLTETISNNDYVTLERGEDVNGAAAFVTTVDFAGLSQDQAFLDVVIAAMESQATEETMTPEELAEFQAALPIIMEAVTFTSTTLIDPVSGYVAGGSFNITFDGAALTAALQSMGETVDEPIPNFAIAGDIAYTAVNDTTVTAPEGAQVVPLDQLMGMLMGGMSGQ